MPEKSQPPLRGGRARQADVARIAGVSQTTVSLVLGGNRQGVVIQEATQARVREAAKALGYVPDPAARRLATSQNNLLGVFSFTATFPTAMEHSYYPFLVGIEQEAAEQGYDLVLFTGSSAGGAGARRQALDRVRLADGCLILGRHLPATQLHQLIEDGFPVVHIGRSAEPDVPWVGADYVAATAEVVRHLTELGHRTILLVREDDEALPSSDRELGFRTGLAAAGLRRQPKAVFRTATPESDITADWVRAKIASGITAIVAEETDSGAVWRALVKALDEAGLRAPHDVSIALLGSPPADLAGDRIPTGFDIPRADLGAAAVRMLAAQLSGIDRPQPLVHCEFRLGMTTGVPAKADNTPAH
ncbi:MAG: Transcriptional regulator [Frankiales bacterium]|nr:Transcriptional regulator [Frankiales bacterium]